MQNAVISVSDCDGNCISFVRVSSDYFTFSYIQKRRDVHYTGTMTQDEMFRMIEVARNGGSIDESVMGLIGKNALAPHNAPI